VPKLVGRSISSRLASSPPIQSPFAARLEDDDDDDDEDVDGNEVALPPTSTNPLPLTLENVEMILDEMRPYLISDGGNVEVNEIDGPVVRLQLIGACGTCPSSTMTMKMGLEKRLKEAIPEIEEVVQALPDTPDLSVEEVNVVLEGIRPFLAVAGGKIEVAELLGVGSVQPQVVLRMEGASASLQSVKLEIMQRIQRHFMLSGLRIEWEETKKGW
jgi:lysyl-tRNA synthetase class 2